VVTADHGEAFGEHATVRHGFNLYDEEIRVPLILHVPGTSPRTLPQPRSAIDLAPTIAELLGQKPSERWRGVSLLRDLEHSPPQSRFVLVDAPELSGVPAQGRVVARTASQAVINDGLKVVVDSAGARAFDLLADPSESAALSPEKAAASIAEARRRLSLLEPVRPDPCGASAPPAKVQRDL
jgi:arylsulfatase A-like enzyme